MSAASAPQPSEQSVQKPTGTRNTGYAIGGLALALGMLGLTYAAVPFYSLFCRVTGYEGSPQRTAVASEVAGTRSLRVAFDTNVAPGLPWSFEAERESVVVRTGRTVTVFFRARNLSDRPTAANATFNVTPEVSGGYFDKIQCFCFSEQHLGPHEDAEWPVVFFLDPKLETDESMSNVDSITLSYTLFGQPGSSESARSYKHAGLAGRREEEP
jgi:cytochrome c oxidase assembly protein subunit 11